MADRPRVLLVFGTRPEAVKMAPVVRALRAQPWLQPVVAVTGQHRALLDQMLALFALRPDVDMALMEANQSLAEITARVLAATARQIEITRPALVLVQGDTSSAVAAALAAFYAGVPVGHIEAGLRTGDPTNPFPEEMNRRLISALATLHFAPTEAARQALLAEGVPADRVLLTGNPVVDALHGLAPVALARHPAPERSTVLVTVHRRENVGAPLERICAALRQLTVLHPEVEFVYPVHPNPNVRGAVHRLLADTPRIQLVEPLDYVAFLGVMARAPFVMTDSGGVQEEAPTLGVPVLVLRRTTERPEGVAAGAARLVGDDVETIVAAASELLTDPAARQRMAQARKLYGDGHAGERIAQHIARYLGVGGREAGPAAEAR